MPRKITEQDLIEWNSMTDEQRKIASPWLIPLLISELDILKVYQNKLKGICPTFHPCSSSAGLHGAGCSCLTPANWYPTDV